MLINWTNGIPNEKAKAALCAALAIKDAGYNPKWPLPNLKPSTEKEYWGWMASYTPFAKLWLGHQTVEKEPATVLAFWMGPTRPSFAVAVIYRGTVAHHPVYFTWTACEHDWQIAKSGHCWRDYKCSKCSEEYHEDSSG